jgi:hypothetical protein
VSTSRTRLYIGRIWPTILRRHNFLATTAAAASMSPPRSSDVESTPLLHNERWHGQDGDDQGSDEEVVTFDKDDEEDPKNWPKKIKYFQVLQITFIGRE